MFIRKVHYFNLYVKNAADLPALLKREGVQRHFILLGNARKGRLKPMEKKVSIILYAILATMFVALLAREVMFYANQQRIKFEFAATLIKKQCLKRMHDAEKERNIHKLMYYRYQHDNAGKVVMELGSDTIIANWTKKKAR